MYSSSIPLTQWCQMSPPSAIHKHLNKCFGQEPRCDSQVLTGQMRNLAKDNVPYVDEPKDYKALSHLKQQCGCLLRGCLFHQETLQFSTGLTATSVCLQGPGTPEQVSVSSSPWYTWFFLKTETKVTSYEEELSHIPQSPHKRGCSAILRTEARMKSFTVQFTHMYAVLPTTLTSMNLLTFTGFDL